MCTKAYFQKKETRPTCAPASFTHNLCRFAVLARRLGTGFLIWKSPLDSTILLNIRTTDNTISIQLVSLLLQKLNHVK